MTPLPRAALSALALLAVGALCGCGGGARSTGSASTASTLPSYASEPFTPEQLLIEKGARLVVADGCSACHLSASAGHAAPSFMSMAGHRVKLTDGRDVLIEEGLIRQALRRPAAIAMAGYDPAPMIRAVQRAHLDAPEIAQLAAFIEQVGPE